MRVLTQVARSFEVFILTCCLIVGCFEGYLRLSHPFNASQLDNRYGEFGTTYKPHDTVRLTNHLEFWQETRVNSLGFLDREPQPTPPNTCRVTFIGDSYVEAAQVPIAQKSHVVFEQEMGGAVVTSAFGMAGMGQVNQLLLYDYFARPQQPDVVVLVFVGNDLGNNSPILEGVRNGWLPDRTPWFFFAPRTFAPQYPDPNWTRYTNTHNPSNFYGFLTNHSYAFAWFSAAYTKPPVAVYTGRVAWLKSLGYDGFGDWDGRNVDGMFLQADLPPVFEDALALTGHALDEWVRRAERDGFTLVMLISEQVTEAGGEGNLYWQRIMELATTRGIATVDQWAYIKAQGSDPTQAHWRTDWHWNAQGHEWAAAALADWFRAGEVCG